MITRPNDRRSTMTARRPRRSGLPGLWMAIIVATAAASGSAQAEGANVSCDRPENAQFDFWVGEWDVTFTQDGRPSGRNLIEKLYGGCALRENWTSSTGFSGGSLNFYDRAVGKWRQTWIGSDGVVTDYLGGLQGAKIVFMANQPIGDQGRPVTMRMTFTPIGPDQVRQVIESSEDGGQTWRPDYDLTYRRRGQAPAGQSAPG